MWNYYNQVVDYWYYTHCPYCGAHFGLHYDWCWHRQIVYPIYIQPTITIKIDKTKSVEKKRSNKDW